MVTKGLYENRIIVVVCFMPSVKFEVSDRLLLALLMTVDFRLVWQLLWEFLVSRLNSAIIVVLEGERG